MNHWSWWGRKIEAMMEELIIHVPHLGFPDYFSSLLPNLSWLVILVCTWCLLSVNVKLLFSPSGKTLNTVINNCPQHVKNRLIDAQSVSSSFHHAFPIVFRMQIQCVCVSSLYTGWCNVSCYSWQRKLQAPLLFPYIREHDVISCTCIFVPESGLLIH